jgi:hypothetical protein
VNTSNLVGSNCINPRFGVDDLALKHLSILQGSAA